jgi:hypothetical protein
VSRTFGEANAVSAERPGASVADALTVVAPIVPLPPILPSTTTLLAVGSFH